MNMGEAGRRWWSLGSVTAVALGAGTYWVLAGVGPELTASAKVAAPLGRKILVAANTDSERYTRNPRAKTIVDKPVRPTRAKVKQSAGGRKPRPRARNRVLKTRVTQPGS